MSDKVLQIKKINWEVVLYYFSAIAMPNLFLFNVYNQNVGVAHIIFSQVLILALIMAVISAVGLLVVRFLTRNYEGSLIVMLTGWLFFWFFEIIFRNLPIRTRFVFLLLIFIGLVCLIILFRIIHNKVRKANFAFMGLAGIFVLLFLFNATPVLINAMVNSSTVSSEREFDSVPIRRTFNIENNLQHPDIYWFLMDGMISLNSVERYFEASQAETRSRLLERGFVINEDAEFVAYNTFFGIPGLLSPDFYDYYLHDLFMEGRDLLRQYRNSILHGAIERDGISLTNDVAPYNELFHAFLQAGYRKVMIADYDPGVYTPIDHFYRLFDPATYDDNPTVDQEQIFTIGDGTTNRHFLADARNLIQLLAAMTPIPVRLVAQVSEGDWHWETIPTYVEQIDEMTADTLNLTYERQMLRALIDSHERATTQPTLTYIGIMQAHPWHWHNHGDGNSANFGLYLPAREYSINVVMNMVDLILERNQNAIIVLQADHGLHHGRTQRALLAADFTEQEVIHLHNSVFSAVRIPEQYGGLNAPLDPRNITRELVNRFVGQNYELRTD